MTSARRASVKPEPSAVRQRFSTPSRTLFGRWASAISIRRQRRSAFTPQLWTREPQGQNVHDDSIDPRMASAEHVAVTDRVTLDLTINGTERRLTVEPRVLLIQLLREE